MADPLGQRVSLAHLPTPLVAADRLADRLGLAPSSLFVKHDDVTGLAGGGNKVRKLEYLCFDAIARGCDSLVTGGGRQSNHVRLTAAAANRLGLDATVVLAGHRPARSTGNVLLDELLGPDIVWAGDLDYYALEAAIAETAGRLAAAGAKPYVVPVGGASAVGALGYLRAAQELRRQLPALATVVVADGSGGTHAGLAAGFGSHESVLGIDVGTRPDLDQVVPAMAEATAALGGVDRPEGQARIDHGRIGGGYGMASNEVRDALRLAARTEGLLLDPVYTGKAMVGLLAAIADIRVRPAPEQPVVFWHTGGLPAIFAASYAAWLGAAGRGESVS